jgi:hypothetical protein
MGEIKAYRILLRKPEGKRPFRKSSRRWEDNIKIDLKEVAGSFVHWIYLAQHEGADRRLF